MIQFLPHNLDLDSILSSSPPSFSYHKDNFVHLLNLITEVPAKKKRLLDHNGFIPLKASFLKKRIHNYKVHIDYLLKQGVIETDGRYIPGCKSKGYRFTETYQVTAVPVALTKYTLEKSINTRGGYDRNMRARYDYFYKWINRRLKIDYPEAVAFLEARYKEDLDKDVPNALARFNARMLNLVKLHAGEFYFRVDETGGRLHTNLTVLKRELRNYLSFDGKKLTAVDISCSQPTLSLVLLDPRFYEDGKGKFTSLHKINPALAKTLPIEKIRREVIAAQDHFEAYRKAVNSDLYEYMKKNLPALDTGVPYDRQKLKELTFLVLYSDNRFIWQDEAALKRQFKELFPEVYKIFSMFKSKDSTALAVLLQRLETELVLNRAAKKFSKAHPGCPLFSVHDALAVESSCVDACSEILKHEALNFCGLDLKLKKEAWNKSENK